MTEEKALQITCPLPLDKGELIRLGHGSGGRMSQKLLQDIFLQAFGNEILSQCQDAAVAPFASKNVVVTTDSYVVNPIFFPGGNIGSLCVQGTVNDLSMRGAEPLYMTVSFIIEEGFPIAQLKEIVSSIAESAKEAKIQIIAGDTKVVERGACDKLFINTTGIGRLYNDEPPGAQCAKPGDLVITSGDLGRHGMAIMCARSNFELESNLESDSAPLNDVVHELMQSQLEIHCMRDITRGGLATCLKEIAEASIVSIEIDESSIPVCSQVQGACEILGLDPLFVACEGRFVVFIPEKASNAVLDILHKYDASKEACIIGKIKEGNPGRVTLKTRIGSSRNLDMLSGEQLPRIC